MGSGDADSIGFGAQGGIPRSRVPTGPDVATITPMVGRARLTCLLAAFVGGTTGIAAQAPVVPDAALRDALIAALTPALPYPRAADDDVPETGSASPAWAVRWPEEDGPARVEVVANPLNAETQKRAAKAEAEAQAGVMRAQRLSQSDYERAVSEFERGSRISPIREISLNDEGVAGERFDAESRLLVTIEMTAAPATAIVASSMAPVATPAVVGALVVRVTPNVYRVDRDPPDLPVQRYAPAEARVYFGAAPSPSIRKVEDGTRFEVAVSASPGKRTHLAVVTLAGNESLLGDVLSRADWQHIRALVEP